MSNEKRVCLGAFAGAFGVKGDVKVKAFTETPENIAAYGPVETEDGARRFTLEIVRSVKPGLLLVRAPEIESREDAESMKGVRFYVDRDCLPAPGEDEFYIEDLVGLKSNRRKRRTDGRGQRCAKFRRRRSDRVEENSGRQGGGACSVYEGACSGG